MSTQKFGLDLILSTFSHEVRTPLAAITGALNLLLDGTLGQPTTEQQGFIDMALRNARRLESLIAAVLESGRATNGDWPVDPVPARLERLVQHGIAEAIDGETGPRVPVDVTTSAGIPLVPADAEGVRRIVKNLVANAARFTPTGASVQVHVYQADDTALVDVCDAGPGVPTDMREVIFERFQQLPSCDGGRPSGGLGLGLFLARRIALAHGGRLECVSQTGPGACFRLTLPLEAQIHRRPTTPNRILRITRTDGGTLRAADAFRAAEAVRAAVPAARRCERADAVIAVLPCGPELELAQARQRILDALDTSLALSCGDLGAENAA